MTDAVAVVALVLAGLAGLLHVAIFVMESFLWTTPAVRKRFGVKTAEEAETTRSLAYNQGFYNLFLAVAAVAGVVVVAVGPPAVGWTLVVTACGSMLLASLVLLTTGARYARAAATQGTLPALALLAALVHAVA